MTGTTPAYRAQRARAMAYGTWAPFAEDPEPVREHVRQLRAAGATFEAIGRAAGVGTMTVHEALNGRGQIRAETAGALLGVTQERLDPVRVPAAGTTRRLRALVAMGHSQERISRALGVHADTVRHLVRGAAATAAPGLRADAVRLYETWWDKCPPERTREERAAAESARRRAERSGWCTGGGLDDDRIDEPGYRPMAGWQRGAGTGPALEDPLGRQRQAEPPIPLPVCQREALPELEAAG